MPSAFSRTLRSLDADTARGAYLGALVAALVLCAWLAWFVAARVTVLATSAEARLEVAAAAHSVQAPVAGRVTASYLALGRQVQAGDVLIELEVDAARLELAESRARLAALAPQLAALRGEVESERQALRELLGGRAAALAEARARAAEADTAARYAADAVERLARARATNGVAELEYLRARAEADERRAAAGALRRAVERLESEQRTQESDRRAHLAELERQAAALEGQMRTTEASTARLEHEVERRYVRAPVAGRLGEVPPLRVGSVVAAGDRLGSVVPVGALRVVAEFAPPDALGRIRPGQPARLRLAGFPWTEYGSVPARVASVGSEVRDGRVRVELAVRPEPGSRIPFEHGLPGTVEVEVERVSPARMVLRAAGELLAGPGEQPRAAAATPPGAAPAGASQEGLSPPPPRGAAAESSP